MATVSDTIPEETMTGSSPDKKPATQSGTPSVNSNCSVRSLLWPIWGIYF
jgi:hypothetical protein